MKITRIFSAAVAMGALVLLATGCSSFETSRQSECIHPNMSLVVIPNVEAGNTKVEGSAKVNCLFGIFTWGCEKQAIGVTYWDEKTPSLKLFTGPDEVAKNGAAYEACSKVNADMLLTPQYDLTVKDYFIFKTVECQVKGFPGTIKNVTIKK